MCRYWFWVYCLNTGAVLFYHRLSVLCPTVPKAERCWRCNAPPGANFRGSMDGTSVRLYGEARPESFRAPGPSRSIQLHGARMATMAEEKPAGTKVDAGVVAEPFRQQVRTGKRPWTPTSCLLSLCLGNVRGVGLNLWPPARWEHAGARPTAAKQRHGKE